MKKYLFMAPVLKFIGEGTLFCRVFASVLRVGAVLLGLGALIAWCMQWKALGDMRGGAILGGILFQALFVVGTYMVVHTIWIRAATIAALDRTEFTVIPIVAVFLKMWGEVYACVLLVAGVALGILLLFGGDNNMGRAASLLPGTSLFLGLFSGGGNAFIAAILCMLGGALGAVSWLVTFYLLSELVIVLVDIARNTRVLRDIAERKQAEKMQI